MKDLKISFSVNEVNIVLKALSNLPYHQVNELISKIHKQAQEQLTNAVITDSVENEKAH
jgi:hypothetical protein